MTAKTTPTFKKSHFRPNLIERALEILRIPRMGRIAQIMLIRGKKAEVNVCPS